MKGNFFIWEKILPALATIIAIILVVVAMLWIRTPKEKTPPSLAAELPKGPSIAEAREDSDKDGLPNWEEMLLKTDPHNADSDGNGVRDGDEQTITEFGTQYENTFGEATTTENLTQKIGRDLYWSYTVLNGFDQYNTDTKKKVASKTADIIEQELKEKPLNLSRLRTTTDISKERVERYRNEVTAAFKPFFTATDDMVDLAHFAKTNDTQAKINIQKNIELYRTLTEILVTMEIPEDAREMHIAMAQTFLNYASALSKILLLHEDPLQAIIGIKEHKIMSEKILIMIRNFHEYLDKHSVI